MEVGGVHETGTPSWFLRGTPACRKPAGGAHTRGYVVTPRSREFTTELEPGPVPGLVRTVQLHVESRARWKHDRRFTPGEGDRCAPTMFERVDATGTAPRTLTSPEVAPWRLAAMPRGCRKAVSVMLTARSGAGRVRGPSTLEGEAGRSDSMWVPCGYLNHKGRRRPLQISRPRRGPRVRTG